MKRRFLSLLAFVGSLVILPFGLHAEAQDAPAAADTWVSADAAEADASPEASVAEPSTTGATPGDVTVPDGYTGHDLAPPSRDAETSASTSETSEPTAEASSHRYPLRLADRPLTLTEGTLRLDQGILFGSSIILQLAFGATIGVTDDLEIGVTLPVGVIGTIARDPILHATGRLYRGDVLEVGLRGAVQVPAFTTGNTDARIGVPIMLHGSGIRFRASLDLDLLFTANVSWMLAVPAELAFNVTRAFTFGAQGWIGLIDGNVAQGSVNGFFNIVVHNGHRALMDLRFSTGWAPAEGDVLFTIGASFYPQLW